MLRLAAAIIGAVVIVLFARTVDWERAWQAIQGTSPGLLTLAALTNIASVALKGMRWHVFLRPIGVNSLPLTLRATFAGAALNHLLVANSGEAARVVFLARASGVSSARVLATAALERVFEILGFFALLALSIWLLQLPPELSRLRPIAIVAVVALVMLLAFLMRYEARPHSEPGAATVGSRVRQFLRGFLLTLPGISSGPRYAAAMALTVAVWALQLASYHYTALAAHFPLPLSGSIAALLAANVGFALRLTPGNVGVFQVVYAMTAVAFGMNKDAATAVALLLQTQQMLPVILLGIVATPSILSLRRAGAEQAVSASGDR